MTEQLICYTAIFGPVADRLRHVPVVPDFHFYAFVDTVTSPTVHETGWTLMPPAWRDDQPQKQARRHKLLPHLLFPGATHTLWVDSTHTPVQPASKYLACLKDCGLCLFRHSQLNCLYQEAEQVLRMRKAPVPVVRKQVNAYRKAGHPYHTGLAETGAVLRRHNHGIVVFNNMWWAELEEHSLRDQISFPYVIRKLGTVWHEFPGTVWQSELFAYNPHIYQR